MAPADASTKPSERDRAGIGAATVALLPWGDVFHDFLDRLGVSLDAFCSEFTGSWMFGYAAALRQVGVRTLVIVPTTSVDEPRRAVHRPTGAALLFLPTPGMFPWLRARSLGARLDGRRDIGSLARAAATHVAPYVGTPPIGLARALRRERCVALLCQEYESPRFDVCVALGRALRIPVYATFQGGDYQMSRLERPLRPLALRGCNGIVVGARSEIERVGRRYRLPDGKIARIANPVDLSVWAPGDRLSSRHDLGLSADASVVAWHGQVQVWRKGLDVLLEAFRRVEATRPGRELRLLLVGSGEDAPELRRRIGKAGPPSVVFVDEWVQDRARLARMLGAADVYAFPSRHEGLPVAPVEAMACGLPVVGADASGVADAVGETGIVVPRNDAPALAAALGGLLDDAERRRELGNATRRRVEERFGLDAVGAQLRDLLIPASRR